VGSGHRIARLAHLENWRTKSHAHNSAINLTLGGSGIPYVMMTPPDSPSAGEIVKYVFGFDFNKDAPRILQTSGIYKESSMSFMAGILMFVALYVAARWMAQTDLQLLRIILRSASARARYDAGTLEYLTVRRGTRR
jgi:hypothetical protein